MSSQQQVVTARVVAQPVSRPADPPVVARVIATPIQRGPVSAVDHWQQLGDSNKWMLAIWQKGKTRYAEIVAINCAEVGKDGVVVSCEVTKIVKELGERFVENGRAVEIRIDSLLWHHVIDEIDFAEPEVWDEWRRRLNAKAQTLM